MTKLDVRLIKTNGGTQCRAKIDEATVAEYTEAMGRGDVFPPLVVFYDGTDHWLADGFHRLEAAEECGLVEIDCDIRRGTARDAIFYAAGANVSSQLRRTNEDKRRAVMTLLSDEEWSRLGNREVARHCGVDEKLVRRLRPEAPICGNAADAGEPTSRTVTRGGTTYQQNTANIGRTRESREEPTPAPPAAKVPPKPLPTGQVGMAPVEDTPAEHQAREAAVFVLDAADRLLAAIRHWPDPADAVERLRQYPSFPEKLPIVAAWLARLDQHWNAQDRASPQTGDK